MTSTTHQERDIATLEVAEQFRTATAHVKIAANDRARAYDATKITHEAHQQALRSLEYSDRALREAEKRKQDAQHALTYTVEKYA